jgi:catechol 2,3-dioxygenase-like lactoylglutathione lyase family enzyme
MAKMTLRHTGILVKSLARSIRDYQAMGFKPIGKIERLKVQKMQDANGQVLELVQGNWSDHIAVNWYRDNNDNLLEVVECKK